MYNASEFYETRIGMLRIIVYYAHNIVGARNVYADS